VVQPNFVFDYLSLNEEHIETNYRNGYYYIGAIIALTAALCSGFLNITINYCQDVKPVVLLWWAGKVIIHKSRGGVSSRARHNRICFLAPIKNSLLIFKEFLIFFYFHFMQCFSADARGWCIKFATGLNGRFTTISSHVFANYIHILKFRRSF
jgi:hypothetical protein